LAGPSGNLEAPPSAVVRKSKPATRTQELTKALKACHAKTSKDKRASCETTARKRYGSTKKIRAKRAKGKKSSDRRTK